MTDTEKFNSSKGISKFEDYNNRLSEYAGVLMEITAQLHKLEDRLDGPSIQERTEKKEEKDKNSHFSRMEATLSDIEYSKKEMLKSIESLNRLI